MSVKPNNNTSSPTVTSGGTGEGNNLMTKLETDFLPSEYDVICGRGCRVFNHDGNQKFRKLVAHHLPEYSTASTKMEKSCIILKVVSIVRERSPAGGFVKKCPKDSCWYEVGDFLAREKTSQAFRDLLQETYSKQQQRSSSNSDKAIKCLATKSHGMQYVQQQGSRQQCSSATTTNMTNQKRSIRVVSNQGALIEDHSCQMPAQHPHGTSSVTDFKNFDWSAPLGPPSLVPQVSLTGEALNMNFQWATATTTSCLTTDEPSFSSSMMSSRSDNLPNFIFDLRQAPRSATATAESCTTTFEEDEETYNRLVRLFTHSVSESICGDPFEPTMIFP